MKYMFSNSKEKREKERERDVLHSILAKGDMQNKMLVLNEKNMSQNP